MKIFSMRVLTVNKDSPFKDLRPTGNPAYEHSIATGQTLSLKWAIDSGSKPVGDYIAMPEYGFASKRETIDQLQGLAPSAKVFAVQVDGDAETYSFLQPKNYEATAATLDHYFLMFNAYKNLLVTQRFKAEWEARGLTGAVFEQVAEFDDSRFIPIPQPGSEPLKGPL